jgi:hypothetical protein
MNLGQGQCPVCDRWIILRNSDGKLRQHGHTQGRPGSECRGSGAPPAPPAPTREDRVHARRSE